MADHVPLNGEDPKLLAEAEARAAKGKTSVYRSASQADRDLREILTQNADAIDALKPGDPPLKITLDLSEPRQAFVSVNGGEAELTDFHQVKAMIFRLPDGSIHLHTLIPLTP